MNLRVPRVEDDTKCGGHCGAHLRAPRTPKNEVLGSPSGGLHVGGSNNSRLINGAPPPHHCHPGLRNVASSARLPHALPVRFPELSYLSLSTHLTDTVSLLISLPTSSLATGSGPFLLSVIFHLRYFFCDQSPMLSRSHVFHEYCGPGTMLNAVNMKRLDLAHPHYYISFTY